LQQCTDTGGVKYTPTIAIIATRETNPFILQQGQNLWLGKCSMVGIEIPYG
jgi:hypothetical protein